MVTHNSVQHGGPPHHLSGLGMLGHEAASNKTVASTSCHHKPTSLSTHRAFRSNMTGQLICGKYLVVPPMLRPSMYVQKKNQPSCHGQEFTQRMMRVAWMGVLTADGFLNACHKGQHLSLARKVHKNTAQPPLNPPSHTHTCSTAPPKQGTVLGASI